MMKPPPLNVIQRILTKPQNSIEFDSPEESQFYAWCEEAKMAGLLKSFQYQPREFELAERVSITIEEVYVTKVRKERKTRTVDRFVFHPHHYTPDFLLIPGTLHEYSHPFITTNPDEIWIDVKGGFSVHNDEKPFSINQKWMYQKHGLIVNKVVPEKFFIQMWVPEIARYTPKQGKLVKKYVNARTVKDIHEIQDNCL